MSIVIAIIIFGVIVIIHEFGHYWTARKCGILVEEFAIGMGPKLFSFTRGDTLYSIRALPIGGYCRMLGDSSTDDDPRAFNNKHLLKRVAVISAGAVVNILFSLVVFTGLVMFSGYNSLEVRDVIAGSPAQQAGFMVGDRVRSVDGRSVHLVEDLSFKLMDYDGKSPLDIGLYRNGTVIHKTLIPMKQESGDYILGINPMPKTGCFQAGVAGIPRAGVLECAAAGVWKFSSFIYMTVYGIFKLVTLHLPMSDLSGPIGIVNVIGTVYQQNIVYGILSAITSMVALAGMLSAALGVFNLIPLPALDGGRLVFLIIEAVRGKPVKPEREGAVHLVGFVLLMILAVFVAYNDVLKIFSGH